MAELCATRFTVLEQWLQVKGNLHATFNDAFVLSLLEDKDVTAKERRARLEKVFTDMSRVQAGENISIENRMCTPIVAAATAIVMQE